MNPIPLLLASYLLGAVPTSYLVGRWARGIDLRQHGSGNLGATNAFRVLGWRLALPVLLFDIFKGWLPTFVFPRLDAAAPEWALAYGIAAIIGHVFSVYVRFRGGKGIATSAGVFLALAPLAVLVGVLIWSAVVAATRIVSLASIVAALTLPLIVYAIRGTTAVFWVSAALAAFVIYAHRSNIRRLLRGEEHRFGRRGVKEVR
ncbi:MAG TPA: glycerol-3-phosphate 1-O-acyltransferase PlsY [Longimicrobiales bacterium]